MWLRLRDTFRCFLLIMVLGGMIQTRPVKAETATAVTLSVKAGLDDACRIGNWLPVQITVDNRGPSFEGRIEAVQEPAGGSHAVYGLDIQVPASTKKVWTVYLYPENYLESVSVSIISNGESIAGLSTGVLCLQDDDRLLGILSDDPMAFSSLQKQSPAGRRTYLAHLALEDMPARAEGLNALDALMVTGIDSGRLSADQQAAVYSWVNRGGLVILSGGKDWQRTAAGFESLMPFQPQDVQSLDNLDGLAKTLDSQGTLTGSGWVATGALYKTGVQKTILSGDIPLVLKKQLGLGKVVYLAFDPNQAPFSGWDQWDAFLLKLLAAEDIRPAWAWGFQDWEAVRGLDTAFTVQEPFPPIFLWAGLGLYLLLILLVLLVIKLVDKPVLTWVFIPLVVLIITAGLITFSQQRQGVRFMNRMAVVQVFPEDAQAHLNASFGFYATGSTGERFEVQQNLLLHPVPRVRFLADDPTSGIIAETVQQTATGSWLQSPTRDGLNTRTGVVEGEVSAPDIQSALAFNIDGNNSYLEGTIQNHSDLNLEDVYLLMPGGEYAIGSIRAGENKDVHISYIDREMKNDPGGYTRSLIRSISEPVYSAGTDWFKSFGPGTETNQQAVSRERSAILAAIIKDQRKGDGRQNAFYLAGWSRTSPYELRTGFLINQDHSNTLYLIRLNPESGLINSPSEIPPAFFTWQVEDEENPTAFSPYQSFLPPGEINLSYLPVTGLSFQLVDALTLHLQGKTETGPYPIAISLWNFQQSDWVPMDINRWGDYSINNPSEYVGLDGQIRLKINQSGLTNIYFEKIDFSLKVNP